MQLKDQCNYDVLGLKPLASTVSFLMPFAAAGA
jgi:hypothetical protein